MSKPTRSLADSRWAVPRSTPTTTSTTSTTTAATAATPSSAQELARFMKIVSRLKWKLPFLSEGYRLATMRFGALLSPADIADAEIMFKLDFYEYYALLERAIVHLLAVFGIEIANSRYAASLNNGSRHTTTTTTANHRYHANVLEALEKKSCPLYPLLGSGPVREQLKRAKQLRNQWKTADSLEEEQLQNKHNHRSATASSTSDNESSIPLESYDLEGILTGIFGGLEQGHALAQKHVTKDKPEMEIEVLDNGNTVPVSRPWDNEADWDFIVDAMDWEAV